MLNNAVNTNGVYAQAGPRWEGNIALNLENTETTGQMKFMKPCSTVGKTSVLTVGSIMARPDALLLAAGYLNDSA